MLYKIKNNDEMNIIKPFFKDIRFFMGKSVLDGIMRTAYVDDIFNPQIAFLTVRSYCFISGTIEKAKLKNIIDENFKAYNLIPSDNLTKAIEEIYQDDIIKSYRYSIKKNNEIIGVASSNIFYKDGIEVNIKVKEQYRRKGIATVMASKLILECLSHNTKVSWDPANPNSVGLAEKLGFKYDSTYSVYSFKVIE